MVSKTQELTRLLYAAQTSILRNVDYIPISQWGFDETALDVIKKQKYAAVNKKLFKNQQKKLANNKKQQISQSMGPQTVSEVYNILSHSKLANKQPIRLMKKDESGENGVAGQPELNPNIMEILKKKGARKRPFVRNAIGSNKASGDVNEDGTPFKKQRKQHMPLTDADREKRRESRKLNRKNKKSPPEAGQNMGSEGKSTSVKPGGDEEANPTIKTASALSFSKLDFVIKGSKPLTKKERRQKLSGRDYAALQKKVENRNELIEKIRSNNPEKAQNLENKIKWDTAIKRAEGKKVKDDLDLLSKAVKRKDKTRQVRKKKWDDRVKKVEQDKQRRQDKRQANIDKRRDEKVKKKLERVHKKGRVV